MRAKARQPESETYSKALPGRGRVNTAVDAEATCTSSKNRRWRFRAACLRVLSKQCSVAKPIPATSADPAPCWPPPKVFSTPTKTHCETYTLLGGLRKVSSTDAYWYICSCLAKLRSSTF